ncbi:unnamed protein product [Bursaphelenchus okinawaensis]|uniref:OCIA domain-containing protein n=1 Tax=Bursaphelenchus okinawaensis TaxID=465554 RepID=A0A811JQS2_9BILA|nr:unnamed protein product [Bursaphelenchus okinawaensis]CAG9077765.1 unnamed protein product [Bursaphelenchus okinawaensis]
MESGPSHGASTPQVAPQTAGRLGLTPEQLKWLMTKLSSDDEKDLSKTMRDCTSEMTATRGFPFAIGTMVSMWIVRNRLPEKYWIGPKSAWAFYTLIGLGSLTAANLLSMNTCADRVRPKLAALYEKYNEIADGHGAPQDRYSQLREQNRRGGPTLRSMLDDQKAASAEYEEIKKKNDRYHWDETAPLLSGTPTTSVPIAGKSTALRGDSPESGTSYGDKDFS